MGHPIGTGALRLIALRAFVTRSTGFYPVLANSSVQYDIIPGKPKKKVLVETSPKQSLTVPYILGHGQKERRNGYARSDGVVRR